MDSLRLTGLLVYARHGLAPWERQVGQPFEVDVEVQLDLGPAGKSDDRKLTVDYCDLYRRVEAAATARQFTLIEAVAEAVAEAALSFPRAAAVTVRVRKPRAALPGATGAVEVEVTRHRPPVPG